MFVFYDWTFPHTSGNVAYFPFNSWLSFQRLCESVSSFMGITAHYYGNTACNFNIRVLGSKQMQNMAKIYFTIRYDTRCYFNVRSKADIRQLNLPHGTDN